MPSYNKVLLMGNLTRDVELKYTTGNQAVANLAIAVNRKYKSKEGELKEEVTFVDCEAWGFTAENLSKFFSKGRPIFVEGRLKLDQWQDKDGSNRSKLRVLVESFEFVDSKGGGDSAGGGGARSSAAATKPQSTMAGTPAASTATHQPLSEDDIPF